MASGEAQISNQIKKTATLSRDVDFEPQDPIIQKHDLLISEIESSDGHLGTSLRSVWENVDVDKFLQRLDSRIKNHDKEIERMCNYHYQGFIESVRSLLLVRADVEKLKGELQQTNASLQGSGSSLMTKGEELVHFRKVQENINAAVETLSMNLPALETYGKLREQMKTKRYYPALKTLEQLEHTYLPRVSKYRFTQVMCETIPTTRDDIKDSSMSDLKDFLENIRKHSDAIGETAMRHSAEQHGMDVSLAVKKGKKRRAPVPPNPFTGKVEKRKAPPPPNPFTGEVEGAEDSTDNPFDTDDEPSISVQDTDGEEGLSAQDRIDFSPVYRCLHIYTVLGARETFESYYRKQRRKQARLALQPPPNMMRREAPKQETLEGYKRYFHDIVGFFVVEDHILNTTQGLVTRMNIDELWDMALNKVVAVLRTHIGFCTDPTLMLQIKALIMLFCHTLKGYGFTVSQLYDLLLEIRDQYSEILMKKWVAVFNNIFDEDNYTPILAEDEDQYSMVTSIYPFSDPQLEAEPFPKMFPFSQFVPKVYCQVKEYIYACLKFSEDLHLSQTEIDDMIRKLANVLLTRTLSGCLSGLIKQPRLKLLQLIQISINMNYLEKSCMYLEDFISNITGAEKDSVHTSKLQGTSMFKDARSEAEEQIYAQINNKLTDFFELSGYDWMMTEPATSPSDYILDLITFLKSTFTSFTNLPAKVAQTACMSACQHITKQMMDLMMDPDVKVMAMGVIFQIDQDLKECEAFARSEPVPGYNDGTLELAFVELRQLIDLFLRWDWINYVAEYGKDYSKYLRVSPHSCIVLLEKLKEADKRTTSILSNFKTKDRDKKRLLDTVLKQLHSLTNNQPHSHYKM